MIAGFGHAMVSKHNEGGLVIHELHDFCNNVFSVQQFAFNFWMVVVKRMACAVNANYVRHQQVEVASILKLLDKTS